MSLIPFFIRATPTAIVEGFPQVILEIAFTTDPTSEAPVWTDVSAYARGTIAVRRGRPNELARIDAGTMTVTLDNRDRRFEAEYSAGAYYPNVKPLRKVRLTARYGSLTYPLYTGYIERWPRTRPTALQNEVTITCVDALTVLAQSYIEGTLPAENTGARVTRVLDMLDWPVTDRFVLTGQSECAEITIDPPGIPALQHLQDVAFETEGGVLFVDGDGKVTFHDRHRRVRDQGTSAGTFGDSTDDQFPYVDLVPSYDLDEVFNHASVTNPSGFAAEAADSASQAVYFKRSLTRQTQLLSDVETEDAATALVGRLGAPATRYDSLTLQPQMDSDLWHHALIRDVGDRIDVTERPMGGTANTEQQHIEGVQHDIGYKAWTTVWPLSPADNQAYFVLEHATLGKLDSTARIAY